MADVNSSVPEETDCAPVTKRGQEPRLKKNFSKPTLNRRKSVNIPAILLVVSTVSASTLYGISALISGVIASPDPCTQPKNSFENSGLFFFAIFTLQNVVVFLLFPIAGWLSDTKIGRYRSIYYSIWFMWLGVGTFGFSYVVYLLHPCDINNERYFYLVAKYVLPVLSLLLINVGAAAYFPNILAFIMEQLMEVSSASVRSYIHWFVWALYVGFFFSDWISAQVQLINNPASTAWLIFPVLISFTFFSIILLILFFFSHLFVSLMTKKENPYSTVHQVVSFAATHKTPLNRSSLTFWEQEIPGRLELAKTKYGGPFRHEHVEDVKTLFRMILVFFSLLPFFIGYSGPINQLIPFIGHLKRPTDFESVWFIYLADPIVTLAAIPLLELVLLPLFPKFEYFIQKPLRWIFIGIIAMTLCNISLTVLDAIAHYEDRETIECFINWSEGMESLNFNYRWTVLSSLLWGICDLLITTSVFTFICSQAPHSMCGMLLGLFMFMQGFFQAIGDAIAVGFGLSHTRFVLGCGLWFWFTLSVATLTGCVVFFFAANSYKSRVRWEVDTYRQEIEDVFERRLRVLTDLPTFSIDSDSRDSTRAVDLCQQNNDL